MARRPHQREDPTMTLPKVHPTMTLYEQGPGRERDMHSTCGTFSAFPPFLPSSADGEQPFSQRSSSSWRTLSRDRRRIRAQDANHVRVLTQNMYFGTNFTALNSAAPAQAVSCGRRPRSAGGHWSYKLDQAGLSPSLPSRPEIAVSSLNVGHSIGL